MVGVAFLQNFRRPQKSYEISRKRRAVFGEQCEQPQEEQLIWPAVGSHRARTGAPYQCNADSQGQLGIAGPVMCRAAGALHCITTQVILYGGTEAEVEVWEPWQVAETAEDPGRLVQHHCC